MRGGMREAGRALILATIVAGGCVRQPATGGKSGRKEVKPDLAYATGAPKVVAVATEEMRGWDDVRGVTLALKPTIPNCPQGHLGAVDAVVKAQHTRDLIAIQVRWPDATKSDTHKSWVWDEAKKAYEKGKDSEDRLALMFNIEGDFSSCMLAGKTFRADVWHWKAARSAPAGLAQDKYHVYSLKPVHKKSREYTNHSGTKVYMARVSDAGDELSAARVPPATKAGDTLTGYVVDRGATGSVADVKARSVHDGAAWTVTVTRKLDTGHDDDVVFEKGKTHQASIACFDRSAHVHHSTAAFQLVVE